MQSSLRLALEHLPVTYLYVHMCDLGGDPSGDTLEGHCTSGKWHRSIHHRIMQPADALSSLKVYIEGKGAMPGPAFSCIISIEHGMHAHVTDVWSSEFLLEIC
jgi:hypothetical protein